MFRLILTLSILQTSSKAQSMQTDSTELKAARLAILATEMSGGGYRGSDTSLTLELDGRVVPYNEAATRLVSITKPVELRLKLDGEPRLSAKTLESPQQFADQAGRAAFLLGDSGAIGLIRIRLGIPGDALLLAIVGKKVESIVPFSAVESWILNYCIPPNLTIGVRPATDAEARLGAAWTLVFDGATPES